MSDSTPPQRTEVLYMVANGSACEVPTPMQGVLPHLSSSGPGSGPGQSPRRLPGPRIGALRACPGMTVEGTARLTRMRSEEHTSELQSLMRISYAVFCLKKKKEKTSKNYKYTIHKHIMNVNIKQQ